MKRMKKSFLAAALLVASMGASAEDIDLFVGVKSSESKDNPNVLILVDNTSNWNSNAQKWPSGKQAEEELQALLNVLNALDSKVNVGLMMLDAQTGGYVRSAMKPLEGDSKTKLIADITEVKANYKTVETSSSADYDRAMFEVFKYFGGYTSPANAYRDVAGTPKDKTHFGPYRYSDIPLKQTPDQAAFVDTDKTTYTPVVSSEESCKAKNYLIVLSNGLPKGSSEAGTILGDVGGDANLIYPDKTQVVYADEYARFLYQTDVSAAKGKQNVITYTIDIYKAKQDLDNTKLQQSMARAGGGKYFTATSASEIETALKTIFSEIQSVNSVFASVSLPVSVNTQGTYLNQVYVGMFRPDPDAYPRWAGNLKQYKLGISGNSLQLQDANGNGAINSSTGFITECARSYWSPSSVTLPAYWSNVSKAVNGGCLTVSDSTFADYPDGNVVEKGAQSYKLRTLSGSSARNVKICPTTGCPEAPKSTNTSLADFNTTTVTSISANEVNWARGGDNTTTSEFIDTTSTTTSTIRPSVHGDIVHSRPVAINFGTGTSKQVAVFYGGNDGLLHAVNGNRDPGDTASPGSSIGGVAPGGELWSFMIPEFYQASANQIARLRDNTVKINFKDRTVLAGETVASKPYGVDGAITAFQGTSATWLYATLRRGGRALYAFDVTTPQTPTFKWRIGCNADGTSCTSGFTQLGQTWSSAKPFKTQDTGDTPLLIMGGGHDTCEDFDNGSQNHDCGSSPKGNRIYILNADTGTQVRTPFETRRSVVGDVTVVPDSNGKAKYAYAADTGGNVYRLTFGSAAADDWSITRIATVGCGTEGNSTCDINRKFMFAPDVVEYQGQYYVLLGSGDREKPLASYAAATKVSNYFFMIKDDPSDSTWLTSEWLRCGGRSRICMDSLQRISGADTPTDAQLAAKKGWYLQFADNEQVVTNAITVYGVVTFSTHTPAVYTAGQCSSLGTAKVYNINYANAKAAKGTSRYAEIAGGGLPPSPVAGMVTLDDGTTVPFVIGSDPESPLQGGSPTDSGGLVQPKANVFWNIEE